MKSPRSRDYLVQGVDTGKCVKVFFGHEFVFLGTTLLRQGFGAAGGRNGIYGKVARTMKLIFDRERNGRCESPRLMEQFGEP